MVRAGGHVRHNGRTAGLMLVIPLALVTRIGTSLSSYSPKVWSHFQYGDLMSVYMFGEK